MSTMNVFARPKSREIHAVITRVDGTVEDLGMISYWSSNPLKMIIWKISKVFHKTTNKKG